jgi:20S proteasome alpha/beta subunit
MHRRVVLYAALVATLLVPEARSDDFVGHGTINVVLGNRNGLVVLTDSMLTDGSGHQLSEPGQKLFKLNDRTICTFAGFAFASAHIPELNADTRAIIHQYVQQSKRQRRQSIDEQLRALGFLFNLHLTAIANVREVGALPTSIDAYQFQLIIAGYDTDNRPKIGKITLETKRIGNRLESSIKEIKIVTVGSKLIPITGGMPDVADKLLLEPDSKPDDIALAQYALALRKDGGASLTVEQMTRLAKRLAYYSSQAHPEVGGENQVAILRNGRVVRIEQKVFPKPAKAILNYVLLVDDTIGPGGFAFAKRVHVLAIRCWWWRVRREIDGNYFIGNTFTDSVLDYDGGFTILDTENQVIRSRLSVGPHVSVDDERLRKLIRGFGWLGVEYRNPL